MQKCLHRKFSLIVKEGCIKIQPLVVQEKM